MDQSASDTGWRGSQEGWLEAAYDALVESGVEAVKIQPLAKKLKLSRTSFYWFFQDREQLLAALLARWRDKNTGNLVRQSEAYAETIVEASIESIDGRKIQLRAKLKEPSGRIVAEGSGLFIVLKDEALKALASL